MNITIFGASGKVGQLVTEKMLAKNHRVTALIHGNDPFTKSKDLIVVQGDIYDEKSVFEAIKNTDLVISTLGSWGTPNKDILASGMRNIIPAMEALKVKRIVSLTGHDARAPKDKLSYMHRISHSVLKLIAPKILNDGELHIDLLAKSNLDWTVVRSPVMNEHGRASYKFSDKRPLPWKTINREAVAEAMLEATESELYINSAPFLTR